MMNVASSVRGPEGNQAMRAEAQAMVTEIEESLELLRRRL